MRCVTLKREEIEALEYLHQNSPNNTVRKRSQCLVLSHQRHKIKETWPLFLKSVAEPLNGGLIVGLKLELIPLQYQREEELKPF